MQGFASWCKCEIEEVQNLPDHSIVGRYRLVQMQNGIDKALFKTYLITLTTVDVAG